MSTFNTANIPPCTGPGAHALGHELCLFDSDQCLPLSRPTPAPPSVNYYNCMSGGPYGNGGGDACVSRARVRGNPGVTNLNPPPVQIWARTDYFPIPGLHNACLQAAGLSQTYIGSLSATSTCDSRTITNPGDHRHDPDGVNHGRHFEHHDRVRVRRTPRWL